MNFRQFLTAVLAAAACAALWPGDSSAADRSFWITDTQDLLDICTVPREDPQRDEAIHYCLAYMDGVIDYHDILTDHEEMKRLICYPDTATLEQGVLVFIDWAQEKQADMKVMKEPPVLGVVRALAAKWPCAS